MTFDITIFYSDLRVECNFRHVLCFVYGP